jgi:NTP pyrophosphatase (non-canonical NTP hydrolase)
VALGETLLELQQLTERLRRDCPWDREQTPRTIVPHTVEEAYEVAEKVDIKGWVGCFTPCPLTRPTKSQSP